MTAREQVILVHGLWVGPWVMGSLARKLRTTGLTCRHYSYATTGSGLDGHADGLWRFLQENRADSTHFVAHSLGGLVTLRMLEKYDGTPPGKVVLLGSPLGGSVTARKAGKVPGVKKLLGNIRSALHEGYDRIPPDRETGMIAGTRGVGLGLLVGGVGGRGDGTVALRETRTPGLADHIELPVTHTGMLYSKEVARQAVCFLRSGGFEHSPAC